MGKRFSLGFLFVLVVIGFLGSVSAEICEASEGHSCYYVATNGSDSNPGTFEEPFGTVQHALDTMSGGDIIYLRGGIYQNEHLTNSTYNTLQLDENKDGTCSDLNCTTGSWSTLKSYPGEWAVLDGENNIKVYSLRPLGVISSGWSGYRPTSYWKIEQLEIKNGRGYDYSQPEDANDFASGMTISYGPFIIRYCYIHNNTCEYPGQNPAGIRGFWEDTSIEYNYFRNNGYSGGTFNDGHWHHIFEYADYDETNNAQEGYNDDPLSTKRNKIRYNLVEGGQSGYGLKNDQLYSSRQNFSDFYNNYGTKVHHNIIRDLDWTAIDADMDFIQVHNNIIENAEGINIGSEWKQYKSVVYNNQIHGGARGEDNAEFVGLQLSLRKEYNWQNDLAYGYVFNNIIDSVPDEWYTNEVSLGTSQSNYNVDYIINWSEFFFDNNYVYAPLDSEIITITENNERIHYDRIEFNNRFSDYKIYQNHYNSSNPLFKGTTGADKYKTYASHELEPGITIANGGHGGEHPYLENVTIPDYVGAVNPEDDAWVNGVLGLQNVSYLKNAPSGDPYWIEGSLSSGQTTECGDGVCNGTEDCSTCVEDCLDSETEVCCSGTVYSGDCCFDGDCSFGYECVNYNCQEQQTYHPADNNPQNRVISFIEIEAYMNRWLNGEISINELLEGINEWRGF